MHFYTTDASEVTQDIHVGWTLEGIACYVYPPNQSPPQGATELYRLFNSGNGDHLYTTDQGEQGFAKVGVTVSG